MYLLEKNIIFNNENYHVTFNSCVKYLEIKNLQTHKIINTSLDGWGNTKLIDIIIYNILRMNYIDISLNDYKSFLEWDGNLDKPTTFQDLINRINKLENKVNELESELNKLKEDK